MGKRGQRICIIGVATYRPEDWGRLRRIAADTEDLERTWTEWSDTVSRTEHQLRAAGIAYESVLVDLDELVQFCREQGLENNADARSRFVAELLRRRGRIGAHYPPQGPADPGK